MGLGALGLEGAGTKERALGQGAAVADFAAKPVIAIALSGEVCGVSARMMLDSAGRRAGVLLREPSVREPACGAHTKGQRRRGETTTGESVVFEEDGARRLEESA